MSEQLPKDVQDLVEAERRPPVYPVLKPHDWSMSVHCVSRPFEGIDRAPVPRIAFGYNAADHYVFIPKEGDPSPDELAKEALENIQAWQAQWQPLAMHMLTASGTDFSAEKILDRAFLIEAQSQLSTDGILVAVPRRRVIYAIDAAAPDSLMQLFLQIFNKTWRDDSHGNAPITPLLFKYRDGKLVGAELVNVV